MNILAVGAHPDDIEIGCFATLAKHYLEGDEIFGAMITNGELGGDVGIRRQEQEATAKEIDMQLFYGNFPDGDVRENASLVTFLDKIIKKHDIDVVYTHSQNDRHQDHRAIARASLSAARTVKEVYSYEDLSLISSFTPQLFVDVTKTFHVKVAALKKHKSQSDRTFVDGLEGIAKFRASQCRLAGKLCEAFEIQKIFKNGSSPYHKEVVNLKNQIRQFKNSISSLNAENEIYKNKLYAVNAGLSNETFVNFNPEMSIKGTIDVSTDETFVKKNENSKKSRSYKDELMEIKQAISKYKNEISMLKEELSVYKKAPTSLEKNSKSQ